MTREELISEVAGPCAAEVHRLHGNNPSPGRDLIRDCIHVHMRMLLDRVGSEAVALRTEFIQEGPHGDEARATVIWQDDQQVTQDMWDTLRAEAYSVDTYLTSAIGEENEEHF